MNRLTFDGNFCDISQCRELPCPHGGSCTQRKVWEKLKAYEDTGLTPKLVQETAEFAIWIHENGLEKIKEWVKADAEGRLVVHGRWAHLGGDEWCCSACGFVITTEGSWDKPTKKYCEDCGARMDGDDDAKES